MREDKFGLRPVWDALLELYDEFSAICRKYGLRQYVTDGALLGAIRERGFLLWDDDLDISMPREDYEKFVKIARRELPPHLKFVYWKNTPEFTLSFGKLQDVREDRIRAIEEQTGRMLSNGLYLDLLPIDGYPPKGIAATWIKWRDAFLLPIERFHLYKYSCQSAKGKRAWLIGMILSLFVPWMWKQEHFLALHEKSMRKYPFAGATEVGRACQKMNVFRRLPMKTEIWGEPQPMEFEGHTIMVPQRIHDYLVNEYGETYMTPPPVSKQHPGHSYSWRCAWWKGPTREV